MDIYTLSALIISIVIVIFLIAHPTLISSSMVTAFITFLWYRKGKLWGLYDLMLSTSIEQSARNSIEREEWKRLAINYSDKLSKDIINSLFRFEAEYLRNKITTMSDELWVADSETIIVKNQDGKEFQKTTDYDKIKYPKYVVKKTFYKDFSFCGLCLFIKAVRYAICNERDTDTGCKETYLPK